MNIKITPADKWFSLCIRERAGWKCERCNTQYPRGSRGLECAHYYGRGIWSTRFDPRNCMALCTGCHSYYHGRVKEFVTVFEARLGAEVGNLTRDANDVVLAKRIRATKGKGEIAKFFRLEYERMLSVRANGEIGYLPFASYEEEI